MEPDTEVEARMTAPGTLDHQDPFVAHPEPVVGGPGSSLRLKKLTLNGFKSFADRTIFTFDQPITGVVGPNGCGKSNLVDAIKWVLGERSSKSLRGKEMIDVIFAGSAGRKPSGMASVTLTFENPELDSDPACVRVEQMDADTDPETGSEVGGGDSLDPSAEGGLPPGVADEEVSEVTLADRARIRRSLPIDSDEVSVERQLYRDGTSRYLINGKRARLRDIRDLFLDTGIGADAYSIIEQGKVDAMLLASPQERRTIFEEAAGIAKYKQRRIEAQRKLDRAEANLVRTREQLESTERRLRIVRGQAAKARRFRELDDECSALRLAVAFDQYDEVCQRLAGLTSQLQRLEAERVSAQHEVAGCESSMQQAELAHAEAASAQRAVEDTIRESEHAGATARQRRQMAERAIEEASRQLEIDTARVETAERQIESLESDIADQRAAIADFAERAADAGRSLEAASATRAGAMEAIAGARHEQERARSALAGMDRDQASLRSEAESIAHRLEELDTQRVALGARLDALGNDRAETESARTRLRGEMETRSAIIARLEGDLEQLSRHSDSLVGARRERAVLVEGLSEERVSLDSRRATLEEMVRSRAGLAEAAKWVIERRESGEGFEGVIAPLAELVETDSAHARAVEAALGVELQALVTRSVASAPSGDELSGLPGRVRFIPLRGLEQANDEAAPSMLGSLVTHVRSLVRPVDGDPETAALLDRLLASVYLVEDLDSALLLAAGPMWGRRGVRFVTRAGEVLDGSGCVDAGPAGAEQGGGLILHASELTELETRLAGVVSKLEAERGELSRLDKECAGVNERRERVSAELAEHRRSHAGEQARADRMDAEIERLERESRAVGKEIGRSETRRTEMAQTRRARLEKADSLEGLISEQRELVESITRRLGDLQSHADSAADQMSKAREDAGRANAQLEAARRELARLDQALEIARESKCEHERHTARARERHAHHEATIAETARELEQAERTLEENRGRLDEQRSAVVRTEDARRQTAESLQRSRERARIVERDWHGVEASRRELEVRRETLEERTGEDLGIDLAAEYLDYRAMMATGGIERVDIPDAQARINVLRGEIARLGNVNLDAIEEENQLTEADEGLRAQIADLDDARVRMTDLIDKLNTASRERFGEVFGLIRENFGGQGGMFRRLFGGGRAEVRLMGLVKEVEEPDGTVRKVVTEETDLLESGIEVIAKPPGKEPRSISQLSGGEKTLTAVALLMAIFRSKPSCFCVLDEVDAALDEVNVGRFSQTVRAFTDMSSFIVITHNKRTMQMADHLYGVTQQERGVSKRVSVRFDRVAADGSFDVEQAESKRRDESGPVRAEQASVEPDHGANGRVTKPRSPSGALRRALAKMRDEGDEPVRVENGQAD